MTTRHCMRRHAHGQALVEALIVLPLMAGLLLGMGWLQQLQHARRQQLLQDQLELFATPGLARADALDGQVRARESAAQVSGMGQRLADQQGQGLTQGWRQMPGGARTVTPILPAMAGSPVALQRTAKRNALLSGAMTEGVDAVGGDIGWLVQDVPDNGAARRQVDVLRRSEQTLGWRP